MNSVPLLSQPADRAAGLPGDDPVMKSFDAETSIAKSFGVLACKMWLEIHYPDEVKKLSTSLARVESDDDILWTLDGEVRGSVVDLYRWVTGCTSNAKAIEALGQFLLSCSEDERQSLVPGLVNQSDGEQFPVSCLPLKIREVAEGLARVHGLPPDMPGAVAIGAAAAAMGKGIVVKSVRGLITFPNLFILVGARSGSGKSVISNPIFRALSHFEGHLQQNHARNLPSLKARTNKAQRDLRALEHTADLGGALMDEERIERIEALRAELVQLERQLQPPRVRVDDVTSERLAGLLGENGGVLASVSPDARSAIKVLMGRYQANEATDDDVYLKGYSVEALTQDRVTRVGVNVVPCLAVVWLTQLDNIDLLYAKGSLANSGLLCRFLMCRIGAKRPALDYNEVQPPEDALNAYEAKLWELLETYHQNSGEPHVISAEEAARKILVDYEHEIRNRIETGEFQAIASFAERWAENAWRMALVFHGAEHGKAAHLQSLEVHNARAAVKVVGWFALHQQRQLEVVIENKEDKKLAAALDFVLRMKKGITARELHRYKQTLFENAEDARQTLNALVDDQTVGRECGGRNIWRYYPPSRK